MEYEESKELVGYAPRYTICKGTLIKRRQENVYAPGLREPPKGGKQSEMRCSLTRPWSEIKRPTATGEVRPQLVGEGVRRARASRRRARILQLEYVDMRIYVVIGV